MPSLLFVGPYRFFCYAGDRHEPPHVHVERDKGVAKFWLDPVRLHKSRGFGHSELTRIERLVSEHQSDLLRGWNEYFSD